jgi:hypothetical protein
VLGALGGAQVAQEFKSLLQENLEILDRATLTEHVPVRTCRLDWLLLWQDSVGDQGYSAAATFPHDRNLSLISERNRDRMSLRTVVGNDVTWSQFDMIDVLV